MAQIEGNGLQRSLFDGWLGRGGRRYKTIRERAKARAIPKFEGGHARIPRHLAQKLAEAAARKELSERQIRLACYVLGHAHPKAQSWVEISLEVLRERLGIATLRPGAVRSDLRVLEAYGIRLAPREPGIAKLELVYPDGREVRGVVLAAPRRWLRRLARTRGRFRIAVRLITLCRTVYVHQWGIARSGLVRPAEDVAHYLARDPDDRREMRSLASQARRELNAMMDEGWLVRGSFADELEIPPAATMQPEPVQVHESVRDDQQVDGPERASLSPLCINSDPSGNVLKGKPPEAEPDAPMRRGIPERPAASSSSHRPARESHRFEEIDLDRVRVDREYRQRRIEYYVLYAGLNKGPTGELRFIASCVKAKRKAKKNPGGYVHSLLMRGWGWSAEDERRAIDWLEWEKEKDRRETESAAERAHARAREKELQLERRRSSIHGTERLGPLAHDLLGKL